MAVKRASLAHSHSGVDAESASAWRKTGAAERRRNERRSEIFRLRDREVRLRFAAQAAGFGIFDLDCHSGDVHFSPELKAMAGLPPDHEPVPEAGIAELVHPDDRPRFQE